MAWEWSHSHEAYADAEANLRDLPREDLEVIFAEWRAAQDKHGNVTDHDSFSLKKYERALRYAKSLDAETLADFIWEKASERATCDNGGWNAWMCPSGCHSVSFSRTEETAETADTE